MPIRIHKLSLKLILALTGILVVNGMVTGYFQASTQESQMLHSIKVGADQLSGSIASATWHAMLADRRNDAYQIMEMIAHKQGISAVRIFNKEGKTMFSSVPGDNGMVGKASPTCSVCHGAGVPLVKVEMNSRARMFDVGSGKRNLAMVTPVYNEPSCSTAACHAHPENVKVLGVIEVVYGLNPVDELMYGIRLRVVVITLLLTVFVSVVVVFFVRRFVDAPIRELIAGAKAVSAMQLDQPVVVNSCEELEELASAFESMRIRLQGAMEELNRFTQSLESKVEERTEQLKVAHQKLLKSHRLASLGQLSASVAHEINNPVSGVLNLAMLVQRIITSEGVPPERLDEVKRYLTQIVNETTRVGRIVQDLLSFSRRSTPQRVASDLHVLIDRTVTVLGHKVKLLNVALKLDLEAGLPPVKCDPSQMQQVLFNLIINAGEAAQNRPEAWVLISTRFDRVKNEIILRVSDNGEGIQRENLSKIFDPFFTTKQEGKGVGLGLAVVYGIIEAHHGDIEVESTPGEGTCFTVRIPLEPEADGR